MAQEFSCDSLGICIKCKIQPSQEEKLVCGTCVSPWHVPCLSTTSLPKTLADINNWTCPDCLNIDTSTISIPPRVHDGVNGNPVAPKEEEKGENNDGVNGNPVAPKEEEKGKNNDGVNGNPVAPKEEEKGENNDGVNGNPVAPKEEEKGENNDGTKCSWDTLSLNLKCLSCFEFLERPVTTTCGHTSCLKCFKVWTRSGNRNTTCPICRQNIPRNLARDPNINSTLAIVIRGAKARKNNNNEQGSSCKRIKSQPPGKLTRKRGGAKFKTRKRKLSHREIMKELKKGLSCKICKKIMVSPVTTPCGHSFCKTCLDGIFDGKSAIRERNMNGRSHRSKYNVINCPSCSIDIAQYFDNLQVDISLKDSIELMNSMSE